jgi:1,2-diacylglycerol 3-beta-glucosyltransferase
MIFSMFAAAAIVYSLFYLFTAAALAFGVSRFRRPGRLPEDLPRVSVVLCARNEESNVPRCLKSLIATEYPHEKMEIIVVDDESSDRTHELFMQYAKMDSRIRVLSTEGEPRTFIGKQRPLNMGIRESSGEIVLGVDADMKVRPGWVKAHVAAYRGNVGVAGGTSRIDPASKGLFARLQAADLIHKISIAMGCAGLGYPVTIMGNNISFRRDAFDAVGGFQKMKPRIVEDMALMNEITRKGGRRLGWTAGPDGVADSVPERDFRTFVEQRRRWFDEAGDLSVAGKLTIVIEAGMALVFAVSLVLSMHTLVPVITAAVSWGIGCVLILAANPGTESVDFLFIPGMVGFQLFYTFAILYRNLFGDGKVVWKGREYS